MGKMQEGKRNEKICKKRSFTERWNKQGDAGRRKGEEEGGRGKMERREKAMKEI